MLDKFAGTAHDIGWDVWTYFDVCEKELILKNLDSGYKGIFSAEHVDGENLSFSAPDTFCVQNPIPKQPPKVDSIKVQSLLH